MNTSIYLCSSQKNNEAGMMTLLSLGLIVLMIISAFFFFQLFNILDTDKTVHHICQQQLIQLQKKVSSDLQRLLQLNVEARAIQKSKALAKGMIVAGISSADPALVAAGERILATSLKSEKVLIGLQNYLLMNANRKMQLGTMSISQQIKKELSNRQGRLSKTGHDDFSARLQMINVVPQPSQLAVRKIPSDDGPPEYELQDQFIQKQALHISWKYRHESGTDGTQVWKKINSTKQGTCTVSLQLSENSFQSILIGDRL